MKPGFLFSLLLALSAVAHAQDAVKRDEHQMHRLHRDPKAYIDVLEDPKRDAYQKPHDVLAALNLKPGETIADIGAGSGYFTFRLAHHVGINGKVFAVDVSPDMILHINRRIRDTRSANVVSVLATPDDPLLADQAVNRIFICDVWHHVDARPKYLAILKRVLKPDGEIALIDFHKKETPVGPPLRMKVSREDVVREFEDNGFRLVREYAFLPYQYFLIFAVK